MNPVKKMKRSDTVRQEPLPYAENGLAPYVSAKTLSFHYGKHHKAYIKKTNELVRGTRLEGLSLERIVRGSYGKPALEKLFNNAAQAWNHTFYWKSMKPDGGGKPGAEVLHLIRSSFGGLEEFSKKFETAAVFHFGSGWIWLVLDQNKLKIIDTHDAENPLVRGQRPLIALDVWEHAYYLDYQNARADYAKVYLKHLVNWGFAESQLREV